MKKARGRVLTVILVVAMLFAMPYGVFADEPVSGATGAAQEQAQGDGVVADDAELAAETGAAQEQGVADAEAAQNEQNLNKAGAQSGEEGAAQGEQALEESTALGEGLAAEEAVSPLVMVEPPVTGGGGQNDGFISFYFQYVIASSDTSIFYGEAYGTFDENGNVTVTYPPGYAVTAPRFMVAEGSVVTVNDEVQISGKSTQDFTSPVEYTITSAGENPTVKTVTVTLEYLYGFSYFEIGGYNASFDRDGNATVTLTRVEDVTALYPVFTVATGSVVAVDGVTQYSGQSAQDFTSPVEYTITSAGENPTVKTLTVAVILTPWLDAFSINDVAGQINDASDFVTVSLLDEVDLRTLVPEFTAKPDGTIVTVAGAEQISGSSAQNFSNGARINYLLTYGDQTRSVSVGVAPSSAVFGTILRYENGEFKPLRDQSFYLYDSSNHYLASAHTDQAGAFSATVDGYAAKFGVFIQNPLNDGQVIRADGSGFVTENRVLLKVNAENTIRLSMNSLSNIEIRGRIVDELGTPIYGADVYYLSPLASTDASGSFTFTIEKEWLKYHSSAFTLKKTGFHDKSFQIDVGSYASFLSLLQDGYIDAGEIVLKELLVDTPFTQGSLALTPQVISRGNPVQGVVHYRSGTALQNATLTVTVSPGVTLMGASSGQVSGNTITRTMDLEADKVYTLTFSVYAPESYPQDSFSAKAEVSAGTNTWFLGEAAVSLTMLTLRVPPEIGLETKDGTTTSDGFTIEGDATAASGYKIKFVITDPKGTVVQTDQDLSAVPTARQGTGYKVSGVKLLSIDEEGGYYTVTATLMDGEGKVVKEESSLMHVVPKALKLTGVQLSSSYFNVHAPQPIHNSSMAVACAYVNNDGTLRDAVSIATDWENAKDVKAAKYVVQTSQGMYPFPVTPQTISSEGKRLQTTFASRSFKGTGHAYIFLEVMKEDEQVERFCVGVLTLLVDPSGIVYDADTLLPIEGAMATLEYKNDSKWEEWPAEEYYQNNPQTTTENGEYGWMVPEGEYRVLVSKEGYEPAASDDLDDPNAYGAIVVPPAHTEVDFYLKPLGGEESEDGVPYLDEKGDSQSKRADAVTVLTGAETALTTGWYLMSGTQSFQSRITVSGDVHIILADGAVVTVAGGIGATVGNSLTIYAQSAGMGMGKLTTTGVADYFAGIGGGTGSSGAITINGGTVTAAGGRYSAGIGSGANGVGTVTINGGSVTATGGWDGPGIGSGAGSTGGNIMINGGIVNATSGSNAAGIGGANNVGGGTITINGGTVNASGTNAGIGGGWHGDGGNITINGGTVTATSTSISAGHGAGIGGGESGAGGNITITGGIVNAYGGRSGGAGIGGGRNGGDSGNITITGDAIVTANGGGYYGGGAGIGSGGGWENQNPGNVGMIIIGNSASVTAIGGIGSQGNGADIGSGGGNGSAGTPLTTNGDGSYGPAITYFTINASAGTGGTISPSGAVSIIEHANQTFTITPDSDYVITSVMLDGANKGAVTSYTIANVTSTHTITATFMLTPKPIPTLDDLDYQLEYQAGVTNVYNEYPQPISRCRAASGVNGLGTIEVYYIGIGGTTYAKTTIPPTNAGTYNVTVAIAEGMSYAAADLSLGMYTINKATPAVNSLGYADVNNIPSKTYNGSPQSFGNLSPVSAYGSVTVYYTSPDGTTYPKTETPPTNAGTYVVTADVAEAANFAAASGLELGTFTVNKAAAPTITWPSAGAIAYGATLSDSSLTGGSTDAGAFAWTDPAAIPTVANSGYSVTFTPNDTENYDWSGVTLTQAVAITVNKADQAAPALSFSVMGSFPKTVTITAVSGAEYSFDGGMNYSETNTRISASAESLLLAIRLKATETHNASPAATAEVSTANQTQAAPAAFVLSYTANGSTDYTVSIPVTAGAEYSFDGLSWGSENAKSGCLPGTTVTGYKRMAATPGFNASGAVSAGVSLPLFQTNVSTGSSGGGSASSSSSTTGVSAAAAAPVASAVAGGETAADVPDEAASLQANGAGEEASGAGSTDGAAETDIAESATPLAPGGAETKEGDLPPWVILIAFVAAACVVGGVLLARRRLR